MTIDERGVELPIPDFGGLVRLLDRPFKILNKSQYYLYNLKEREKKALHKIRGRVLKAFNRFLFRGIPEDILRNERRVDNRMILTDKIIEKARSADK